MKSRPSTIALLGVNMIPVAGVLFLDWRVLDVLLLYWAENVVIGIINVFRMALAKEDRGTGDPRTDQALREAIAAAPEKWETAHERVRRDRKIKMIPFFILHYGVFCVGHYVFLFSIFHSSDFVPGFMSMFGYSYMPVLIGIGPIAASHVYSFFTNFIGKREYRHTTAKELMHRPYGRVMALHIAIVTGGALVDTLGEPVYLLVILVFAKTLLDAVFHSMEHDKLADAGHGVRD